MPQLWPEKDKKKKTKQNTKKGQKGSSLVVQQVKDMVLLELWHRLQLRCKFNPWPSNFHMPWTWTKKRGKELE